MVFSKSRLFFVSIILLYLLSETNSYSFQNIQFFFNRSHTVSPPTKSLCQKLHIPYSCQFGSFPQLRAFQSYTTAMMARVLPKKETSKKISLSLMIKQKTNKMVAWVRQRITMMSDTIPYLRTQSRYVGERLKAIKRKFEIYCMSIMIDHYSEIQRLLAFGSEVKSSFISARDRIYKWISALHKSMQKYENVLVKIDSFIVEVILSFKEKIKEETKTLISVISEWISQIHSSGIIHKVLMIRSSIADWIKSTAEMLLDYLPPSISSVQKLFSQHPRLSFIGDYLSRKPPDSTKRKSMVVLGCYGQCSDDLNIDAIRLSRKIQKLMGYKPTIFDKHLSILQDNQFESLTDEERFSKYMEAIAVLDRADESGLLPVLMNYPTFASFFDVTKGQSNGDGNEGNDGNEESNDEGDDFNDEGDDFNDEGDVNDEDDNEVDNESDGEVDNESDGESDGSDDEVGDKGGGNDSSADDVAVDGGNKDNVNNQMEISDPELTDKELESLFRLQLDFMNLSVIWNEGPWLMGKITLLESIEHADIRPQIKQLDQYVNFDQWIKLLSLLSYGGRSFESGSEYLSYSITTMLSAVYHDSFSKPCFNSLYQSIQRLGVAIVPNNNVGLEFRVVPKRSTSPTLNSSESVTRFWAVVEFMKISVVKQLQRHRLMSKSHDIWYPSITVHPIIHLSNDHIFDPSCGVKFSTTQLYPLHPRPLGPVLLPAAQSPMAFMETLGTTKTLTNSENRPTRIKWRSGKENDTGILEKTIKIQKRVCGNEVTTINDVYKLDQIAIQKYQWMLETFYPKKVNEYVAKYNATKNNTIEPSKEKENFVAKFMSIFQKHNKGNEDIHLYGRQPWWYLEKRLKRIEAKYRITVMGGTY